MEKLYEIDRKDGTLALKTKSFRAEKGSVLHSGIFNTELASSFVAAGVAIAFLVITALWFHPGAVHYVVAALLFVITFPLSRTYLFREACLHTVFDRKKQIISVSLERPFVGKTLERPLDTLKDIALKHTKIEPKNPDAIAFVEKIALQHGTVIPGFGQTEDFYSVALAFEDMTINVFVSRDINEARSVMVQLQDFVYSQ
jgi:hypothetical protein